MLLTPLDGGSVPVPPGINRRRWIFLLILFTTSAGFFIPVPNPGWMGFSFKGILFLIDLLLVAMVVLAPKQAKAPYTEADIEGSAVSGDLPENPLLMETRWEGYGKAFRELSNEYIAVIRRTFSASFAVFYLKNGKGLLRIHSAHGAEPEETGSIEPDRNPIEHVAAQKKPYLSGTLPADSCLPGIRTKGIRSLLGIPLLWGNKAIGVLAIGSNAENDFSEQDSGILARYGDMLTRIMAAYHRGLVLETDYEVIKAQFDLETALKSAQDEDAAIRSFVEYLEKLFPFDRFACCLADGNEGLIRYVHGQMDQQKPGMRFSLDEGLVGWVMKRKVPLLIPDIQKGDYLRPRYSRNEASTHGLHSFLGVPLGKDDRFKGCLSLESRNPSQYNDKIKDVFNRLTEQLDDALDRLARTRHLRAHLAQRSDSAPPQFEIE